MFCAATTSKNVKNFSPLRRWQFYDTHALNNSTKPYYQCMKKLVVPFFLFFHSLLSRLCFFFFFFRRHRSSFFFCHTNFPLFLSEIIMGDNVKEFTNEERSLLKFQKKQQHGQVLLSLLLLLVLVIIRIRVVVLYCFCL